LESIPERREQGSEAAVYERAAQAVRRLTQLAAASDDEDSVRDALVLELAVVLELESVTLTSRGGGAATRDAAMRAEPTESAQGHGDDRPGRELVLTLRSSAPASEAVVLVAREHRPLGADEAIAAAMLVDVTAVALALLDARHQAATDDLTGCLSRRTGLRRLGEELARSSRTRSPVSCVMLDLDNLKQINDTFGHLEGDRILRETGASLRAELRAYDLAARYGGDEFLVVLPAADHYATTYAAARMTAAIARIKPPAYAPAHPPVSVSVGAATSRPEERPDTLLQRADRALLAAKRARTRRANP